MEKTSHFYMILIHQTVFQQSVKLHIKENR